MAEETTYFVIDTHATQGARTHEMVTASNRIVQYKFPDFVTAIPVPHSHAMRFSAIEGFEVYDKDQNQITTKTVTGTTGTAALTLRADEVIANLDELTAEALRLRVLKIPGNTPKTVPARTRREELVAILVKAGKPKFEEDDGEGDDLIDADDEDEDGPPAPVPVVAPSVEIQA